MSTFCDVWTQTLLFSKHPISSCRTQQRLRHQHQPPPLLVRCTPRLLSSDFCSCCDCHFHFVNFFWYVTVSAQNKSDIKNMHRDISVLGRNLGVLIWFHVICHYLIKLIASCCLHDRENKLITPVIGQWSGFHGHVNKPIVSWETHRWGIRNHWSACCLMRMFSGPRTHSGLWWHIMSDS